MAFQPQIVFFRPMLPCSCTKHTIGQFAGITTIGVNFDTTGRLCNSDRSRVISGWSPRHREVIPLNVIMNIFNFWQTMSHNTQQPLQKTTIALSVFDISNPARTFIERHKMKLILTPPGRFWHLIQRKPAALHTFTLEKIMRERPSYRLHNAGISNNVCRTGAYERNQ